MLDWQLGPENTTGFTRNTNPDGISTVDPFTLHASAHADLKAYTIVHILVSMSLSIQEETYRNL